MARSGFSLDESYVQGGILAAIGLPQPTGATCYNGNNQLLAYGATTLSYDFNGNLTSATDTTGTASVQSDALGSRSAKTINGVATSFLYDGLNPVQELSGTTPTANMLTGLRVDEVFTRTDGSGQKGILSDTLVKTGRSQTLFGLVLPMAGSRFAESTKCSMTSLRLHNGGFYS